MDRLCATDDFARIRARMVYDQGIADRIATFETEPRMAADVAA